ncbi:DEKNAAC103504 [Brettanomyces naardenensis]|uniref:DEKNAAC103504 n=1 Tax=Brettanomyces naardenensis TaxID=13370 RepID=A0A448YP24_BRENA|nr:DEKNAAC103504 [Brettanomyces naardenensis]
MSFGTRLFSGTSTSVGSVQDLQGDVTVPDVGEDSVSDLCFSPVADFLAVANWDRRVRIYEVSGGASSNAGRIGTSSMNTPTVAQGRAMYAHDAPVLSCRFTPDGTKVVSGGADKQVRLFDLASQQTQVIGQHDQPVKCVRPVACGPQNTPCFVSGSWDRTIRYWDTRQQNPMCTVNMPERVYSLDAAQKLLVVATAGRNIEIINLNNPNEIFRQSMSPLKYQTRTVACYPKGDGFAVGSIEGRCAIQYVDEIQQKDYGFSFKCQREQKASPKEVLIYAVNSIVFHPVFGTFATAGADGTFSFWDKDSRHRLKGFPSLGVSIPVVNFNRTGSLYAYALGYDWSKGYQYNTPNYPNMVRLHACKDEEVKPRGKRK